MKYLLFLFLNGCTMTPTSAQLDLDQYRWQNRVILLFTTDQEATTYRKQVEALNADPGALRDRDLVVHTVTKKDEVLWRRYSADGAPFRCMLLGKDGGVKLNETEFVPSRRIFTTIDAMPMRRREMRERDQNDRR